MTQDEIIEMARQAGMVQDGDMWFSPSYENYDVDQAHLEAFAKLVAAKEREACAKVCADLMDSPELIGDCHICVEAIRARGEA